MNKEVENTIELVLGGYANGISLQLAEKQKLQGPDAKLTKEEKEAIISEAA